MVVVLFLGRQFVCFPHQLCTVPCNILSLFDICVNNWDIFNGFSLV